MPRRGDNKKSFYLWSPQSHFDRFYTPKKNAIADFEKLNYCYAGLSDYALWLGQKELINRKLKTTGIQQKISDVFNSLGNHKTILQQYSNSFQNSNIPNIVQARVLQILNEGIISGNSIAARWNKMNHNSHDAQYTQLVNEIRNLYDELNIYYQQGYIEERSILLFNRKFGTFLGGASQGYSSKGLAPAFKEVLGKTKGDYVKYKYTEAELLVDELLANNIDFGSMNVGSFTNASKQLIEDSFIYNKNTNGNTSFYKNQILTFKIKFKNSKAKNKLHSTQSVSTWEDFEKAVKKIDKNKYTIEIDDSAYEILLNSKALSVQTKSHAGGPNSIINSNTNRYSTTIDEIGMHKDMLLSVLVNAFNVTSLDYDKQDVLLERVSNLYLTRYINHLAIIRNDLYFTENGLENAAQWMNREQRFLKFSTPIDTINELLQAHKARYYSFKKL